jgi:phage/plasmid-associated DNA primase
LTTTNASDKYAGIDIRNDSAVVFAPPTKYKLLDGTIIAYEDLGGEILPIPDIIRNNLKMFDKKIEKKVVKLKKKIVVTEKMENAVEVVENCEIKENNKLGDYDKFVKMKDCYTPERLRDYDDYIKFSIAVKLCFGESGRKIWNEICKKNEILTLNKVSNTEESNYDEIKNNEQWNNLTLKTKKEELSFGSLCYWAKEDNLPLYTKLFGKKTNWDLRGEAEFAKQFSILCFDNNIIFTGKEKQPEGYMFNGVYWETLSLHYAELNQKNFDNLYVWYKLMLSNEKNELPPDLYKALSFDIKRLNCYTTRCAVVKIFKEDNYQPIVEWNKNKDLFVFEDKVYDLSKDAFVEANPKEMMNLSCGKKYDVELMENGKVVTEARKNEMINNAKEEMVLILKGIVNPCDYEFFLKQMSSFLKQENKEEKGYFWLGKGRNGKGTSTDGLRNVLGNYWGELSIDYYTNHSQGLDRPNQNLYNCRNARVLNSSEVNETDAFNRPVTFLSANFKGITGQDVMTPRELGTKNVANFIAGKTLIQLNKMPSFPIIDEALRQRIVIHEFPNTFTDDLDLIKSDPSKYKMKDIGLKEKLHTEVFRIAFTNLLFEYYRLYKVEYVIPQSVKDFTQSYFAEQSIKSFIQKYYEPSFALKASIALETIKQEYMTLTDKKVSVKKIKDELDEAGYDVRKINGIYSLKDYQPRVSE